MRDIIFVQARWKKWLNSFCNEQSNADSGQSPPTTKVICHSIMLCYIATGLQLQTESECREFGNFWYVSERGSELEV